jgi:hypothetical protein
MMFRNNQLLVSSDSTTTKEYVFDYWCEYWEEKRHAEVRKPCLLIGAAAALMQRDILYPPPPIHG